jgi:hypothetical protein
MLGYKVRKGCKLFFLESGHIFNHFSQVLNRDRNPEFHMLAYIQGRINQSNNFIMTMDKFHH